MRKDSPIDNVMFHNLTNRAKNEINIELFDQDNLCIELSQVVLYNKKYSTYLLIFFTIQRIQRDQL